MSGWKCVEEVLAYQLAVELRDRIIELTESGKAARDYKFRDQIRDSAASATRNLAEGFARFDHPQFAYLARVARGSLGETKDCIGDGCKRRYFSEDEAHLLSALAKRAMAVTTGLIRHLATSPTPKNWGPDKQRLPVE